MHAIMEICLLRNLNINPVYHTKIGTELSMMVIFCQEYDILGFDGIYIYIYVIGIKQTMGCESKSYGAMDPQIC